MGQKEKAVGFFFKNTWGKIGNFTFKPAKHAYEKLKYRTRAILGRGLQGANKVLAPPIIQNMAYF